MGRWGDDSFVRYAGWIARWLGIEVAFFRVVDLLG